MCVSLWRMASWIALLVVTPGASASPTADDYRPCHQQAARLVEMCLNESPGADGSNCWRRAQAHQQACYRFVRTSHVPDRKRIEAMRQAEQEARKRAEEARKHAEEERQQ